MDRVASDRRIAAASLATVGSGPGRTLAVEVSGSAGAGAGSSDATLGSGAFGKVGTYRYHGAAVAVKELKPGADEDSIGALPLVWGRLCIEKVMCHGWH